MLRGFIASAGAAAATLGIALSIPGTAAAMPVEHGDLDPPAMQIARTYPGVHDSAMAKCRLEGAFSFPEKFAYCTKNAALNRTELWIHS